MNELPKISIVTPSLNQGAFLEETLQSLVDQNYPHLEVIIQDGKSTDDSVKIAEAFVQRHPELFKLYVESDRGQADALDRGFKKATGEILGFLNSDDVLIEGCLQRVAQEIDPKRNRYIVFGRSQFFGNDPAKEGIDHPFKYTSHFDQLAIWKRRYNQIPQPSTFWHRTVWDTCGGIDSEISHAMDYDLFCRFSQTFRFHAVAEVWSRYRLHDSSKTVNKTRDRLIEECIEISRRYWGTWLKPLRWRCEISHGLYQRSQRPQAMDAVRKAEASILHKTPLKAFFLSLAAAWKAPLALAPRILYPIAATRGWTRLARLFQPETPDELCPNFWIGPFYETPISLSSNTNTILVEIEIPETFSDTGFQVVVEIEGNAYFDWKKKTNRSWAMEIPVRKKTSDSVQVLISSNQYFVPKIAGENDDTRFLSLQLLTLQSIPSHPNSV